MDFFKSVFANDPDTSSDPDPNSPHRSDSPHSPASDRVPPSFASVATAAAGAWSFGSLIKTLAARSESVIETYRRDLEEFRSGLQKETEVIHDVASRAVKDLPGSLEAGASAAQESLETVGQAIDDFGSSVWRGTTEIISQGKDALQFSDLDNAAAEPPPNSAHSLGSKRYSRFEVQVMAIQNDPATFLEDPDDSEAFRRWCLGFDLDSEKEEIERLCEENGSLEAIHSKLVADSIDHQTFWTRYFYRIHELKVAEDARANLVKRAIASDADEDLSWEIDDEDEEVAAAAPNNQDPDKQLEPQLVLDAEVNENKENFKNSKKDCRRGDSSVAPVEELNLEVEKGVENSSSSDSAEKSKAEGFPASEGKAESCESSKDSDFSVVQEEEDLGWDEIEDLGSSDEKKTSGAGSPNREQLRKRLSMAPEDEDLSWDIEDDDESNNKH